MSNDNERIIDAEIVDNDRLPAIIKRASNSEPIELPNRQDSLLADNPGRRCVATNSRGERCRKFAIYGATVCRTHGGATKKTREAARIRVENAANRLMGKLIEFAFDDTKPPDVQLKAIQNSLDRAGLKPPAEVVLSQGESKAAFESVFDSISAVPLDESAYLPRDHGVAGGAGESLDPGDFAHPTQPSNPQTGHNNETATTSARENPGWPAGKDGDDSSDGGRLGTATRGANDRDRRNQRAERHITGEAAIRAANWANAAMAESHGLPWGESDRWRR
ncbi:hypothetical protein AO501_12415 [Mycobacterium gordonae]|uniref:Uncharacterized protein n=1 Tax=Mycobacterium gordonae TaxID=1778 RepID=A0A0Q2QV17_MYCGO|nr:MULTISPECIES: hypothetical protein [Mycobacterium]KQH75846.1 hypothetical protein AO501_12415 [Mycobacterium gordonae]MDP7732563.1 hypothetical protein [Mycobacterium sp. TY813]